MLDTLERAWHATGEDVGQPPPVAYLPLIGAFTGGFGGMFALARKRGTPLPQRIGLADLLLLGVATFRVSRLLAKDEITEFLRAPFVTNRRPAPAPGEVTEDEAGTGVRRAIGEWLTCPFCLGVWVGAGFTWGLVMAPRATRLTASVFAVEAISTTLNLAYNRVLTSGSSPAPAAPRRFGGTLGG